MEALLKTSKGTVGSNPDVTGSMIAVVVSV